MIFRKCLLGVAVLILLAFSAQAFAQSSSGSFAGTVKDPTGAVVPGASVTVKNTETGVESKFTTNNTGTFNAPGLLPGYYEITVDKEGFAKSVTNNLRLENGLHKVDVKLEAGKKTDVVEVNIKAENIILESGPSVGMVIPEDTISKLPLVNSNVLDLVKVMGGVVMTTNPIFGADDTTLAGLSASQVNVQKDGVTANNVRWATGMNTPVNLNPDMVAEFKVIIAPVDAEMGRGSGQIQVVTRSGGNAYRGSVTWNIQNSALNSNDWYNNHTVPKTIPNWSNQHELVLSGSGPIIKNKTFIFALFDYTRAMSKATINPQMPTACAKKGIYRYFEGYANGNMDTVAPKFSTSAKREDTPLSVRPVNGDGTPRTDIPVAPTMPSTGSAYAKLRAISVFGAALPANWDPALDVNCANIPVITDKSSQYYNFPSTITTYPTYGTTGTGSKYDQYRTPDPTGYVGRFMDLLELPNNYSVGDGLNWGGYRWTRRNMGVDNVYGVGESPNRKQINIRLDHNFSNRHRASASYTYEKNHGDDNAKTMPNGFGGTVNRTPQTLSVTLTSTLKPSLLNELRVGYMRTSSWVNGPMMQPETGAQLRKLIYDLLPTADWTNLQGSKIDIPVLISLQPNFNVGQSSQFHPYGSSRGNFGMDWGSTDPRLTLADTITFQFGRHSWRIGAETQRTSSDYKVDGDLASNSVFPLVSAGSGGPTVTGFDPTTVTPPCPANYPNPWGNYCYNFVGGYVLRGASQVDYSSFFPGATGAGTSTNVGNARSLLNMFSGSLSSIGQYFFINSPTQTSYNSIKEGEIYRQSKFYQNQINWFAQDNWRVTDDLTLQLGMRWEWYGVPYLANGMTAGFTGGQLSAFGYSGRGFNTWLTKKWDPFSGAPVEDAYKNCLNASGQKTKCDLTTLTFIGPDSPHPEQNYYNDDYNNFGPVAGFAYTLPWGGKGKTVLRGGIQINYMTFGRANTAISDMPGLTYPASYTVPSGTYKNLADVKNLIPITLPSYIIPPTNGNVSTTPLDQRRLSLTAYDPNIRNPYTQSLNLRLSRTIGSSLTIDVVYAGNLSRKSSTSINLNTPNMVSNGLFEAFKIARAGGESPLLDKLFGNVNIMGAARDMDPVTRTYTLPSGASQLRRSTAQRSNLANGQFAAIANWLATANIDRNYNNGTSGSINIPAAGTDMKGQLLRYNGFPENFIFENPQYSSVNWNGNFNKSNYHSMQAMVTLRPTHGLMLSATYTWSKSMGYNGISDYGNRDIDYGLTSGRAHSLSSYGTFDLPFGPNRWLLSSVSPNILGRIIGGWQMSWIYSLQTGAKQTISGQTNYLWGNNTASIVNPFDFKSGYVDWKPGAAQGLYWGEDLYSMVKDPQCTNSALVTTANGLNNYCTLTGMAYKNDNSKFIFVNTVPGTQPNMGRYNLSSPSNWSADGAFSKSVRLTEGKTFQIRIDATNIFNHPVPAAPWVSMAPMYGMNFQMGYIFNKTGNRKFQARLRFDF